MKTHQAIMVEAGMARNAADAALDRVWDAMAKYSPSQERDTKGRWTTEGGAGAGPRLGPRPTPKGFARDLTTPDDEPGFYRIGSEFDPNVKATGGSLSRNRDRGLGDAINARLDNPKSGVKSILRAYVRDIGSGAVAGGLGMGAVGAAYGGTVSSTAGAAAIGAAAGGVGVAIGGAMVMAAVVAAVAGIKGVQLVARAVKRTLGSKAPVQTSTLSKNLGADIEAQIKSMSLVEQKKFMLALINGLSEEHAAAVAVKLRAKS